MAGKVRAVPEGFHTITPHLVIKNAAAAIEFYKKAFGAETTLLMPSPDGKTISYAALRIGDSVIQISDDIPQMERWISPTRLGGTTVALNVFTEKVDALWARALAAGATVSMPLMDMFWGDRYGKVTDPFGHEWCLAEHTADLTPEQIAKGAEEFFSKMPPK